MTITVAQRAASVVASLATLGLVAGCSSPTPKDVLDVPNLWSPSPSPEGIVTLPPGETIAHGAWDITVLSVDRDATEAVSEFYQPDEEIGEDEVYVVVTLAATFKGTDPNTPAVLWSHFRLLADLADGTTVYADKGGRCPNPPNPLRDQTDVFPGGTLIGDLCFVARKADVNNVAMVFEPRNDNSLAPLRLTLPADGEAFSAPEVTPLLATSGPLGSRGNPYPMGTTVTVGRWDITVTDFDPNASDTITGEDLDPRPPVAGRQEAAIYLIMTNHTKEPALPLGRILPGAVSDSVAVAYGDGRYHCRNSRSELPQNREIADRETVTGHVCWAVLPEEADSLVFFVEEMFTPEDTAVYFATH